jgi:hypothetical protein
MRKKSKHHIHMNIELTFINGTAETYDAQYGNEHFTLPPGLTIRQMPVVEAAWMVFGYPSDLGWSTLDPDIVATGKNRAVCYFNRNGDSNPVQFDNYWTFVPGA